MRKTGVLFIVAALVWGGLSNLAYGGSGAGTVSRKKAEVYSISPVDAKKLIETKDQLQLVDVRTPQEFSGGALPGSTLVTYNSWSPKTFLNQMEAFDREKPLLLVCAVGGRSWAAALALKRQGFQEVYNLNGGLQAWARQRVPLPEAGKKQP
jgi:rhodanese-related sulfurtransferase